MKLAALALAAVGVDARLQGSQQMLVAKTSVADDSTSVVSGLARSLAEIQLRASTAAQVSPARSAALDVTSVTSRACDSIALLRCRSIFDAVPLLLAAQTTLRL